MMSLSTLYHSLLLRPRILRKHLTLTYSTAALSFSALLPCSEIAAQEAETEPVVELEATATEGVAETLDKHRRGPILTVQQVHRPGRVTLRVDATHVRDDLKPYPIQIDYYVNRHHFASQVRSPELPGALGADIGSDVAVPPFNYTIVAKVLHPNSIWTTVAQGAALPQQFDRDDTDSGPSTYDCDLDRGDDFAIGEAVVFSRTASNTYSFTVADTTSEELPSTSVVLTVEGTTGNATLSFNDGTSAEITGTVTSDSEGTVTGLDLANEDEEIFLACSQVVSDDDSNDESNDDSSQEESDENESSLEALFTTMEFE